MWLFSERIYVLVNQCIDNTLIWFNLIFTLQILQCDNCNDDAKTIYCAALVLSYCISVKVTVWRNWLNITIWSNLFVFLFRYVQPPVINLSAIHKQSTPFSPIVFILSPGSDPASDLMKLAEKSGSSLKFLAMGQGQEKVLNTFHDLNMKCNRGKGEMVGRLNKKLP